jgi:hypothetical protein
LRDAAQHPENNHQHTQGADAERCMMEVFHRAVHVLEVLRGPWRKATNSSSWRIMLKLVAEITKALQTCSRCRLHGRAPARHSGGLPFTQFCVRLGRIYTW